MYLSDLNLRADCDPAEMRDRSHVITKMTVGMGPWESEVGTKIQYRSK